MPCETEMIFAFLQLSLPNRCRTVPLLIRYVLILPTSESPHKQNTLRIQIKPFAMWYASLDIIACFIQYLVIPNMSTIVGFRLHEHPYLDELLMSGEPLFVCVCVYVIPWQYYDRSTIKCAGRRDAHRAKR